MHDIGLFVVVGSIVILLSILFRHTTVEVQRVVEEESGERYLGRSVYYCIRQDGKTYSGEGRIDGVKLSTVSGMVDSYKFTIRTAMDETDAAYRVIYDVHPEDIYLKLECEGAPGSKSPGLLKRLRHQTDSDKR